MQVRRHLTHLTNDELRKTLERMYVDEKRSSSSVSKELGVSREFVNRWLDNFDIPRRTLSDELKLRHERMTPEERKALAHKANEAVRGSTRTVEEKVYRAVTVSENAVMSHHEKTFAHALIDADLYDFIFSYPVHIYNIDFAFPLQKIAVEVDGGNWHTSPRKQTQDNKKEAFLTSEGWTIVRWSTAPHLIGRLPDVIALLKTRL
jgi:very-short-patch-repair endonuclease